MSEHEKGIPSGIAYVFLTILGMVGLFTAMYVVVSPSSSSHEKMRKRSEVVHSPQTPSETEVDWYFAEGRLIKITSTCYRHNNKIEIAYMDKGIKRVEVLDNVSGGKYTEIFFDIEPGKEGWVIPYQAHYSLTQVYDWGMIMHLPRDYQLTNCQ